MHNTSGLTLRNGTAYFVVAHVPPLFPIPSYSNLIKTSNFELNFDGPSYCVSDFVRCSEGFNPKGNYLADYAVPLIGEVIRNKGPGIASISISLHRKVILRNPLGVPARNYPGMYTLTNGDQLTEKRLSFDNESDCLLMSPLRYGIGLEGQYKKAHVSEDFDALANYAVECGVMSSEEVNYFRRMTLLIPGIPFGVLPIKIFEALAAQHSLFVRHLDLVGFVPSKPDDLYQRRARSFFLERLHSFWFMKFFFQLKFTGNDTKNLELENYKKNFGSCINIEPNEKYSGIYTTGV